MGLAFGPISRFMTRGMYRVLESRHMWCDMLTLSQEAHGELQVWVSSLDGYNCQPICHSPSVVRIAYSDASEAGFGGYVVEDGACQAYSQWTPEEAGYSSTWRILMEVCLAGSQTIRMLRTSCK